MTPKELAEALHKLHVARDEELRAKFDRSLSFEDGFFDRWERARRLGFGEGASIYNSASVFGDVRVGTHTWIGPYVLLDGSGGGLEIGAYCSLAAGTHIYTHDTVLWSLSGGRLERRAASVGIGACTYIGSQSVIGAGATVGHHCVIGANSFVNDEVPPYTIVGGVPARRLGRVEIADDDVHLVYDSE